MAEQPDYWKYETSGVLRPAVEAYLTGGRLSGEQIAVLRAYLRQWIAAECWQGPMVPELVRRIDDLTNRAAIEAWLDAALDPGIDPL